MSEKQKNKKASKSSERSLLFITSNALVIVKEIADKDDLVDENNKVEYMWDAFASVEKGEKIERLLVYEDYAFDGGNHIGGSGEIILLSWEEAIQHAKISLRRPQRELEPLVPYRKQNVRSSDVTFLKATSRLFI